MFLHSTGVCEYLRYLHVLKSNSFLSHHPARTVTRRITGILHWRLNTCGHISPITERSSRSAGSESRRRRRLAVFCTFLYSAPPSSGRGSTRAQAISCRQYTNLEESSFRKRQPREHIPLQDGPDPGMPPSSGHILVEPSTTPMSPSKTTPEGRKPQAGIPNVGKVRSKSLFINGDGKCVSKAALPAT